MAVMVRVPNDRMARLLTAEAACFCRPPPAAVVLAAVACITGADLAAILRQPDVGARERRILLPRRHATAMAGIPLSRLLHWAGAEPVEVGADALCPADELAALLAAGAAACLLGDRDPAGLAPLIRAGRDALVPTLVVAGEAIGPLAALDAGADLVLVDLALSYGGPGLGLIVGSGPLVRACAMQDRGIGRLFRPAEDDIAAAIRAVEAVAGDIASGRAMPCLD